jgi:hypothetical protein
MLVLIVYHYQGYFVGFIEPVKVYSTLLSLINFFSWVGITKYLRRASGIAKYIELLENSLISLLPFGVIIITFMLAFGTSITTKFLI